MKIDTAIDSFSQSGVIGAARNEACSVNLELHLSPASQDLTVTVARRGTEAKYRSGENRHATVHTHTYNRPVAINWNLNQ